METVPPGFIGNLSELQLSVLEKVRVYVNEKGHADDPRWTDWNLLRFCRARKFDLKEIVKMIDKFLEWFHPAFENVGKIDFAKFDALREIYGHGYLRQDKRGRPVYVEKVKEAKVTEIFAKYTDLELQQYYIQSYERLIHIMFPECSKSVGKRVEQTLTIMDLNGVNILSLFIGKVKDFTRLAINIGQNYYPEIMGNMYIINSGWLFSGVWAIVKGWLDVKTQEKIKIVSGSGKKELLEAIEEGDLAEFLGGRNATPLRWDHGVWDEELRKSRNEGYLFHPDRALVERFYPPVVKKNAEENEKKMVEVNEKIDL